MNSFDEICQQFAHEGHKHWKSYTIYDDFENAVDIVIYYPDGIHLLSCADRDLPLEYKRGDLVYTSTGLCLGTCYGKHPLKNGEIFFLGLVMISDVPLEDKVVKELDMPYTNLLIKALRG